MNVVSFANWKGLSSRDKVWIYFCPVLSLKTPNFIQKFWQTNLRTFYTKIRTPLQLELIKTAVLNEELDTETQAATNKLRDGFVQ